MADTALPLITIGITAYNAAQTLPRAIECALNQSWPNKEIIIADDASTDDTADVIKKYTNQYPEIRAIRNDVNSGVGASRNAILRNMRGEYVAFFDDDDVSETDRVEKQWRRIKDLEKNSLVICHTARKQIYPDGTQRIEATPGTVTPPVGTDMFEKILLGNCTKNGFGSMATCSVMLPRTVIDKIGFYDENFRRCEDTDYTLRFALQNGCFAGIAEALVTQTMNISSEKTLSDEKYFHSLIYKKYADQLGKRKTGFALKWLDLRYAFLNNDYVSFTGQGFCILLKHPVLSFKKAFWVMPNVGFNFSIKNLHRGVQ